MLEKTSMTSLNKLLRVQVFYRLTGKWIFAPCCTAGSREGETLRFFLIMH